jgi:putative Mg2+ transporter-C (MgtC) family protein
MGLEGIEILIRLGSAALIGCVLGLNRELRDRPAGMRTHGVVCLGSALMVVASFQIAFDGTSLDRPAVLRTVQGLLAGIGFLGGGAILRDNSQQNVQGLTTAASIWVAAGLGIVGLTLTVLIVGTPIERLFRRWFGTNGNGSAPPE